MNRLYALVATLAIGCTAPAQPQEPHQIPQPQPKRVSETDIPGEKVIAALTPKPSEQKHSIEELKHVAESLFRIKKSDLESLFHDEFYQAYQIKADKDHIFHKKLPSNWVDGYKKHVSNIAGGDKESIDAIIKACVEFKKGTTMVGARWRLSDADHQRPYQRVIDTLEDVQKEFEQYKKDQIEIPKKIKNLENKAGLNPRFNDYIQAELNTLYMQHGAPFIYSKPDILKERLDFFAKEIQESNYSFAEPEQGYVKVVFEPIATPKDKEQMRQFTLEESKGPVIFIESKSFGEYRIRIFQDQKSDSQDYTINLD